MLNTTSGILNLSASTKGSLNANEPKVSCTHTPEILFKVYCCADAVAESSDDGSQCVLMQDSAAIKEEIVEAVESLDPMSNIVQHEELVLDQSFENFVQDGKIHILIEEGNVAVFSVDN
jgi:hypothetical protein